ncbi:MAG: single-stranded-DNA-specific exonuclease RecJ [Bryobacteraceae bacterium]|nr:single-stranded-DNA-specific exonuclease RecJ [Bryobacteraceae bacterium]
MSARWVLPSEADGEARRLAGAMKLHEPAARVLIHRGYRAPEQARQFLEARFEDLHSPFLLKGMEAAARRLRRAVEDREPVLLYGDYDVDGATSVLVLQKTIEAGGGAAAYWIPHRLRDGYGMKASVVEQAAADGVRLIISVDTGIRASAVVARANQLGIDVIVTDHHLPEAELPPACAVLNPKQPDCPYPDKNLCGAGVAFKLAWALLETMKWPEARRTRLLKSLVKLVAIGTVADVVPLTGENRILVKHGLEGLREVRNPGLRALLEVAGFREGEIPTAPQVAFRIAPRLNAAGRMAEASDVIELFLTPDPARARELASRLHGLNQERQQTEAEMLERIYEICCRKPVTAEDKALVFSGAGWHRGVVGIVASRLVERYHRPVVVLGEDPATGLAQGSGRSIPQFHLLAALESMADLFTQFGGHRLAAGVMLPVERVDEFRQRLNAHARMVLRDQDLEPVIELDARLSAEEVSDVTVGEVLSLAPFGFGNPTPLFGLMGARLEGAPRIIKERHARLRLAQNGAVLNVMAWNAADALGSLSAGATIDAAVTFEEDPGGRARGYAGWTAVLRHFRPAVK